MKKKIYFCISAILQIIASIFVILNVDKIIKTQLNTISETYSYMHAEFKERAYSILQNSGPTFVIISTIVTIIFNIIILKTALTGNILKNKGTFIVLSIISLFITESSPVALLSIINIIVLLFLKRKNPEDYPSKERKQMPVIEYKKATKKEIIFSIILIVVYFSQFLLEYIIPKNLPFITSISIVIGYYILVLIFAIIAFKDKLKQDLKLFKDNFGAYIKFILPRLGIMYIIYTISSLICTVITQQAISKNQSSVEAMPLWFIIPAGIIWAPVVEELVFRGTLRRFIKNDILFIILSAIFFGLMHTYS